MNGRLHGPGLLLFAILAMSDATFTFLQRGTISNCRVGYHRHKA